MKKPLVFTCFLFFLTVNSFSQNVDSLLKKIASQTDESKRIDLITVLFALAQDKDPVQDMQIAKQLLQQAYDTDDRLSEAMALSEIGYAYRSLGNLTDGLDYTIKAFELAEQTKNEELVATVKITMAMIYKDLADYPKTISLLSSAERIMDKLKNYKIQSWAFMNLSQVYHAEKKTDSALMYAQRAYELALRIGYTETIGFICIQLGKVHAQLGNESLALGYFDMALKEATRANSPKYLNMAFHWLAENYQQLNKPDSAIFYAHKAIDVVQNTAFSNMSLKPAKLLAALYDHRNNDSSVKYLKMYIAANDSLFNTKTIQQAQLLTFENEIRQQQLEEEKERAEEHRQQNIQYALLALGIIVLLSLYLLLSRSFIANTRLIEFFGVVALLIVFEFLNLLLHPFLERVTNHSPFLMLLALVCIASLLVPLHHKSENWAIKKLVEKNKQVRLAAARKTLEKLEGPDKKETN